MLPDEQIGKMMKCFGGSSYSIKYNNLRSNQSLSRICSFCQTLILAYGQACSYFCAFLTLCFIHYATKVNRMNAA